MSDLHRITVAAISGRYVDVQLVCIHPDAYPPEGGCFAARLLYEAILHGGAEATPELTAELKRAIEQDDSAKIVLAIRFLSWAERSATYRIEVRHERWLQHLRVGLSWASAAYTEWFESNEIDLWDIPKLDAELKELFGERPVPALLRQCLLERAAGKDALLRDGKSVPGRVTAHLYGPRSLEPNECRILEVAAQGLGSIIVFGRLYAPFHYTFGFLYTPGCSPEDPPVVGIREDRPAELFLVGLNLEDLLTRDLEKPIEVPPPALLSLEQKLAPHYMAFLASEETAHVAVPVLRRHRSPELVEPLLARVSKKPPLTQVGAAAMRILSAWHERALIPCLEQLMSDPEATEDEGWQVVAALGELGGNEALPLLQRLAQDPSWWACLRSDLTQAAERLGVVLVPPTGSSA